MNATAISNNDMVYLHWYVPDKIPGCLGFTVIRHDHDSGSDKPLSAMVGFPGDKATAGKRFDNTNRWPIQKYAWKDVFAERGGTYWYEIIPMGGQPGSLKPDMSRAMRTNSVRLDPNRGTCSVFFNRGIISTQAIAESLPKSKSGLPNVKALEEAIQDPSNRIRGRFVGYLGTGVLTLLKRALPENGECYCALYELSDQDLIENLKALQGKVHIIPSNAGSDTGEGSKDGDGTNHDTRKELHDLGIDVIDRMFKSGHIGHNKFVVYVKNNIAKAVLCGSTNWTPTGLCAPYVQPGPSGSLATRAHSMGSMNSAFFIAKDLSLDIFAVFVSSIPTFLWRFYNPNSINLSTYRSCSIASLTAVRRPGISTQIC